MIEPRSLELPPVAILDLLTSPDCPEGVVTDKRIIEAYYRGMAFVAGLRKGEISDHMAIESEMKNRLGL